MKLFTPLDWISRGLFCVSPSFLAVLARSHQVTLWPTRSRSPRPSISPCPALPCVPMIPAFAPLTVMNGLHPPPLVATVPQVGLPDTW